VEERFLRNLGAITKQEQEKLRNSRIFIAGCGGLGGYVLEHLVRIGVGHIVCADSGSFEASNLNRQILSNMGSIGRDKNSIALERALEIWPEADVCAVKVYLDEKILPVIMSGCVLAIDALDNADSRMKLFKACGEAGIPLIHGAVCGWQAQAAFVPPNGNLYELLYRENVRAADSVLSFAPGMAASMQAALAVQYLCDGQCGTDLHIFDLRTMSYDRAVSVTNATL